jgi:hypothetical protein
VGEEEGQLGEDGGVIVSWERRTDRSSGMECIVEGIRTREGCQEAEVNDDVSLFWCRKSPGTCQCPNLTASDKIAPFNCVKPRFPSNFSWLCCGREPNPPSRPLQV